MRCPDEMRCLLLIKCIKNHYSVTNLEVHSVDVPGGSSGTPDDPRAIQSSPSSVPPISNAPKPKRGIPNVQAVTHHELPFRAELRAGLGYKEEIILSDIDSKRYLYKLEHNGIEYEEAWKKELPHGMPHHCYKGLSNKGNVILQDDEDKETVCYDESLNKKTVLRHKGRLLDCISDEIFYRQGATLGYDWKIIMYKTDLDQESTSGVASALRKMWRLSFNIKSVTLNPPPCHPWRHFLSVCRTEGGYVAVETLSFSMDIFDTDGRAYSTLKIY